MQLVLDLTTLSTTVKKPEVPQATSPLGPTKLVMIEFEAEDAVEVPAEFVAVTVNVYRVPAVRPVTEIVPLPACEIVPVIPPGEEVAVYEVIAAPPLEAGAVNETLAVVAPVEVAATAVGAPATVTGGIHIFVLPPSPALERSESDSRLPQYEYEVNKLVLPKAALPIEITLLGIVSEVSEVALLKAASPIEVTLLPIVSEVSALAPAKA